MSDIKTIDAERRRMKVSIEALTRQANLSQRSYQRILSGQRSARPDTLARLAQALPHARGEKKRQGAKTAHLRLIYRLILVQLALNQNLDPKALLTHDPQRKATSDPMWVEISRFRAIAAYLMKSVAGIPNADVARAAEVTEAAISISVSTLELKRNDPDFDRLMTMFEMAVTG